MLDSTVQTRRARAGDEDALVDLRAEMFREMEVLGSDTAWRATARRWFESHLADPRCGIFVVTEAGRVVACAMGLARDAAPSPTSPEGGDVLISNVCTLADHRGRGHGRAAFEAVLAWARRTGAGRAELLASDSGRPMYERAGFEARRAPVMRLPLH